MLLRVGVAYAGLLDGTSLDNDISIRGTHTLRKLVASLAVDIIAASGLGAGIVHLGGSTRYRAAEVEDTAEQWTQRTQTADHHTDTVLGVTPDDDVTDTMDVVLRIVEVDGVLETNASRKTGQNTQAQEEDD